MLDFSFPALHSIIFVCLTRFARALLSFHYDPILRFPLGRELPHIYLFQLIIIFSLKSSPQKASSDHHRMPRLVLTSVAEFLFCGPVLFIHRTCCCPCIWMQLEYILQTQNCWVPSNVKWMTIASQYVFVWASHKPLIAFLVSEWDLFPKTAMANLWLACHLRLLASLKTLKDFPSLL